MTTAPGRTICWTPIWNKSLEGVGLEHLLLTECAADSVVLAIDDERGPFRLTYRLNWDESWRLRDAEGVYAARRKPLTVSDCKIESAGVSRDEVQTLTRYTIAKYVAFVGFGAGALLIFGPMVSPTVGHWLLSIGVISGVTAERMAWGPIALFGTLIPGSIAICVGLVALTIAIVLRVRARSLPRRTAHGQP